MLAEYDRKKLEEARKLDALIGTEKDEIMKAYTTYEQAADKPQAGRDTRTEAEWMEYYRRYVDKAEYTDFEDWLADMIRSGNLAEEKE